MPPGRSGLGKISSRYFAIRAENNKSSEAVQDQGVVVGFSQIEALKKHALLVFN